MAITIHQLNVLKAIYKTGSVSGAAEYYSLTQPAISNIIKKLEQNVGYKVIKRSGRNVVLTEAGNIMVRASGKVKTVLDDALSEMQDWYGSISGTVSVTIVSTAKYFAPRLFGAFQKQYPNVTIKLTVCNRQEVISLLKNESSDLFIMSQIPDDLDIDVQTIYEDELVVAAAKEFKPGNAIDFQKTIPLSVLIDEKWIVREPGSGTRIVMEKIFKQYDARPALINMEVGNNESIKQLIIANMGISIISRQSIELELKHHLIQALPVEHFPLKHMWYMVSPKRINKRKVIRELYQFASNSYSRGKH